jgi:GNAT superfamily N-acetyltransferase
MSAPHSVALSPVQILPSSSEYQTLQTWPFNNSLFYEAQIPRLLQVDIPHRVAFENGMVWVFKDSNSMVAGFGTLALSYEHVQFSNNQIHTYIPLLAVHPNYRKHGYGTWIVEYLVAEAALLARSCPLISDRVFLDVYTANPAAGMYSSKCGFTVLNPTQPIPDPAENNEPFLVMVRSVALAPSAVLAPFAS